MALRLALAAALALFASAAQAQKCDLRGATGMVFTGYTPFGAGVSATSRITYRCQPKVVRVWITIGAPRTIASGANTLAFGLYQDAARGAPWDSGVPVPTPADKDNEVTVYGFLPPQDAAAGAYARTLVVSIYADSLDNFQGSIDLVVSADVAPACVIAPATLDFGTYDPLAAAPKDALGIIGIACTRGTSYAVGLGPGNHAAGATRRLASGANRLEYGLYSDAGRTSAWTSTSTVTGVAPSTAQVPLAVHGRIPAGQPAAPGAYGDVVQSTIHF